MLPYRETFSRVLVCVGAWLVLAPALAQAQPSGPAGARTVPDSPNLDRIAPPSLVVERYTVEDGLSVNNANDLAQTPDGYLWIATNDGLARFDGVRFQIYRTDQVDAFSTNRFRRLVVDGDGGLWINDATDRLIHYHAATFTEVTHLDGLELETVRRIHSDPSGEVWAVTDRSLARATGPYELARVITAAGDVRVRDLLWDADGTLWLSADTGLYRIEPDASVRRLIDQPVHGLSRNAEGVVVADVRGEEAFESRPVADAERHAGWWRSGYAFNSADDNAWSVDQEQVVWSLREERTRLVRNGQTVLTTVTEIQSVLHDQRGNTWVATNSDGLFRIRPSSMHVLGTPEGVVSDNLYAVHQTEGGSVWLGSYDFGVTRVSEGRVQTVPLPTGFAVAFHADRSGALWVGGQGLCRIDQPDDVVLRDGALACEASGLPTALVPGERPGSTQVLAIHEDRSGRLWIGVRGGLWMRPTGCDSAACWTLWPSALNVNARVFHERADGAVWMGTSGAGLVRYTEGRLDTLSVAQGFPSDQVRDVHEDADGVLWIGTETAGLVRLDPRWTSDLAAMPRTVYRKADGLFNDGIHRILPDGQGRWWMSTNQGLFWVQYDDLDAFHRGDLDRIRSVAYTERDGMRNREANGGVYPAGMRDRAGQLWFPTQSGVVVFDPATLGADPPPAQVFIEEVRASDRAWTFPAGTVSLEADRRDFEIQYTAPNFADPEALRFAYRLDRVGREDEGHWVEAGMRRTAFFTNVAPGTYAFRVRARNDHGDVSEESVPLVLSIAPYFTETGWFRLLLTGIAGLGLVGLYHLRVRQLKQREQALADLVATRTEALRAEKKKTEEQAAKLLELDAAKSRFFANVSHEFRTPLTLSLGPLEDIRSGVYGPQTPSALQQIELAVRNNRRLLRLVNQLLEVARVESGAVKLALTVGDLGEYVRVLAQPFVGAAERRGIAYTVTIPAQPVRVRFDPDHLDKVVANLLSNAIKFTPRGGAVHLSVRVSGADAEVAVRDTGPGIAPELRATLFDRFVQGQKSELQPGTGIGLALAKELTDLHGGTLTVESEPKQGSTFTLRLPMAEVVGDGEATEPDQIVADVAAAADAPVAVEHLPEHGEVSDRTTVLVVDDHADIRTYLRSHLERHGAYRVLEAEDGEAALALVRDRLPDLIVSDVMMPRHDGFSLLEALRADPETDFLPIILLTARAEAEDRLAGLSLGADDYLTKPFDARELTARVDNLIAQRRRLRERFATRPTLDGNAVTLHPTTPAVTSADAAFLEGVRAAIEAGMEDELFGIEALTESVGRSRSNLHKRLTELIDETPSALLRRMRLERGAALLGQRAGTVSEVAYAVGFKSVSHFSSSFSKHFGMTPTAYAASHAASLE
ncbi:MAG: ATP-binding protein [Bacteroidota bacterium]